MKGLHRTEIAMEYCDDEYKIPAEILRKQNRSIVPIYIIDKQANTIWLQENNKTDCHGQKIYNERKITEKDISKELRKIILYNPRTGEYDNNIRMEYILEATNSLLQVDNGIAALPTGTGKSLIIAILTEQIKEKILIIVPSVVIAGQMKGLLKTINTSHKVDVLTHITAAKMTPDVIGGKPKYNCIIFDECHKMQCNSYLKSLFRSETVRVYGLSASISKYNTCSAKFHIGKLVYMLPYSIASQLKSSINGIKYFHKFEFGKVDKEKYNEIRNDLSALEECMIKEMCSIKATGYEREMELKNIRARYVNMAFLLAERNEARNSFIAQVLQAIAKNGLLNISFLRTKECGRLITKKMPAKSTLFWCAEGIYILEKEGNDKLKKVDYDYVNENFGKTINNILATSCLQMGVNLQFKHGTINSIMLLSGSTHNTLTQQVGRAVRCNPSLLPARAHTIIDRLPLLETNANNRIEDLHKYFGLQPACEFLHSENKWQEEYDQLTKK